MSAGKAAGVSRRVQSVLLIAALLVLALGLGSAAVAGQLRAGGEPGAALAPVLPPVLLVTVLAAGIQGFIWARRREADPFLLPLVMLLLAVGLPLIFRLRGLPGVWQQLTRGLVPGLLAVLLLIWRPNLVEYIRRWAIPISGVGLFLTVLTAFFGVVDESGSRLSLKLGPLPAIQTSEILKLVLLIFLAWYIEREGAEVEGRATTVLRWIRVPAFHYFIPGLVFVGLATLALVKMSDFGAVLILGSLFVGMLYAGFETRIFATIAGLGLAFSLVMGLVLAASWEVPAVIQNRFLAFRNPWSTAEVLAAGQPAGVTISAGPGYQIQQAIYAVIAGGVAGTGLGFGSPEFIPLAVSDFIFAALVEELGAVTALAVLACYAILILRILRVALLLPPGMVFERLLLIGIGVHFFIQVFIMVGGTLNLLPLTGVTVPFLSLGGVALLVNLVEVGLALAISTRARPPVPAGAERP